MRELKRRRNIGRATKFKAKYVIIGDDAPGPLEREFDNLKSMRQWIDRNEESFDLMVVKTLALIYDEWEPFTTVGKKTVTLSDLYAIVRELREDYNTSKNGN